MARESAISAAIGLFLFLFLIFTFASTSSPVQPYFAQLAGSITVGAFAIIVIGVIVVIWFIVNYFNNR